MKQWFSTFTAALAAGLLIITVMAVANSTEKQAAAAAEARVQWDKNARSSVELVENFGTVDMSDSMIPAAESTLLMIDGLIVRTPAGKETLGGDLKNARATLAKQLSAKTGKKY